MTEQEIEEMLGAYALDAIDPEERREIEAHLGVCPRCRAEVAAHREVAALLANSSGAVPDGLWDRIAGELSPELPAVVRGSKHLIAQLPVNGRRSKKRSRAFVATLVGIAASLLVIALLSAQIVNLYGQVHSDSTSASGLNGAVTTVLSHQHRTITLTDANKKFKATIAVSSQGDAYWVSSNLGPLPKSETYQLWTVVRGAAIVSLGVLGPNPKTATGFRLQSDMSRLMVTVEPEGGTPAPTSQTLVSGTI
jgi:anti-sigma-K factor RskA